MPYGARADGLSRQSLTRERQFSRFVHRGTPQKKVESQSNPQVRLAQFKRVYSTLLVRLSSHLSIYARSDSCICDI